MRVIVVCGAGDKAFTAGGDIGMFMQRDAETLSHLHVNVAAPERCPKPVIAQLHGYCFGVGLELALACDFRVASDDVQLALPELTLGMIPGSGGASRLVKLIGVVARQGHGHARPPRRGRRGAGLGAALRGRAARRARRRRREPRRRAGRAARRSPCAPPSA